MKNKKFVIVCCFLVCLLLATITGCREEEPPQTTTAGEEAVLIIGTADKENELAEGQFETSQQGEGKASDAKKLGGSATLDVEYSDDENVADEDKNAIKEPQWLPGIW